LAVESRDYSERPAIEEITRRGGDRFRIGERKLTNPPKSHIPIGLYFAPERVNTGGIAVRPFSTFN
jgi:hypothetical protein